MASAIEPADERRHTPGPDARWRERYDFDFHSPKGSFGGHLSVWLWPRQGHAWYWAGVVEEGRPLISIVDTEVPLPRHGLELRTSGLWADHIAETPLQHWSVGLEAFAVRLDDPTDVFGSFRGERVPLGFDLEWEAIADEAGANASAATHDAGAGPDASDFGDTAMAAQSGAYTQACVVHGEVLIAADTYALTGSGGRSHTWGELAPVDGGPAWPRGGLPVLDDVDVVGWSPARLPIPGGGAHEEARALCRAGDGTVGWRRFTRTV
jgi:hypothetical protein